VTLKNTELAAVFRVTHAADTKKLTPRHELLIDNSLKIAQLK